MTALFVDLTNGSALADNLIKALAGERARLEVRRFPDGESYLRLDSDCGNRNTAIIGQLSPPDAAAMPLMLAADTLRDLGARSVGLIAPYLPYMRQDRRFKPGESISSKSFARFISGMVDWLATVDPHLHRYGALDEIYKIPTIVCSASPLVVDWIRSAIRKPLVIGPDAESEQWVKAVAGQIPAPWLVLEKTRSGDKSVRISIPRVDLYQDHTPVLVDDIISTGHTMIETAIQLLQDGLKPPVCIGTHAIFADQAYQELELSGVAQIITCNTIEHQSNAIDVTSIIVQRIKNWQQTGASLI